MGDILNEAEPNQRILIMTSVQAEQEAIQRGVQGDQRFDVLVSGVGVAAAAAATARAVIKGSYKLIINAGIGGGFVGKAEVGSVVVANEIIAADLGAETEEGFYPLEELNLGTSRIASDVNLVPRVVEGMKHVGLSVHTGPILTLSTVTGSMETADQLARRVSGATAEGMEGFGVATAAEQNGLSVVEIRAISNAVGPRNRGAWRIKEALETLEAASSVLTEVVP